MYKKIFFCLQDLWFSYLILTRLTHFLNIFATVIVVIIIILFMVLFRFFFLCFALRCFGRVKQFWFDSKYYVCNCCSSATAAVAVAKLVFIVFAIDFKYSILLGFYNNILWMYIIRLSCKTINRNQFYNNIDDDNFLLLIRSCYCLPYILIVFDFIY